MHKYGVNIKISRDRGGISAAASKVNFGLKQKCLYSVFILVAKKCKLKLINCTMIVKRCVIL